MIGHRQVHPALLGSVLDLRRAGTRTCLGRSGAHQAAHQFGCSALLGPRWMVP